MNKAERKLLQKKEAELFLEKEQYIDWFGKGHPLAIAARSEWCSIYEALEMLNVEADFDLPDNVEGIKLQDARKEIEKELATNTKSK